MRGEISSGKMPDHQLGTYSSILPNPTKRKYHEKHDQASIKLFCYSKNILQVGRLRKRRDVGAMGTFAKKSIVHQRAVDKAKVSSVAEWIGSRQVPKQAEKLKKEIFS